MNAGILIDVLVDGLKLCGIISVLRIFDDNLLAPDVSFGTQTKGLHKDILVKVDVEHHRVVVGLICEEC